MKQIFTWLALWVLPSFLVAQETAKSANAWMEEGVEAFFEARIADSVKAFDEVVKAVPEAKPQLWQRGLALYYAERFQDGREQFEVHQTVNGNDVENAVWHFLCVARLDGVEAARKALIPISGDSRVPMKEVHELFAGTGTVEAVLKAAGASETTGETSPKNRNHLCYAHLYLGLYFEAMGEEAKAKLHLVKAATDYEMDHYMGKTAVTHVKVRGWGGD
jgi:lipoprotein NlpI